jgi:hypothetical protein
MNDAKRVSNKNWTMLLVYRSVWNDMVSQQKTRLAKLRALLGPMGSESRFPKLVGLSASWIKKASAGNLPMTGKAAAAIYEATGVNVYWLMGPSSDGCKVTGEDSIEPIEEDGITPYTIDSYNMWKWKQRDEERDITTSMNTGSVARILQVLAGVSTTKNETVAAFELWEFYIGFNKKYGIKPDSETYCWNLLKDVERLLVDEAKYRKRKTAPLDKRPLAERIIKGRQAPALKPQKKQPSRKSKRPA